MFCVMLMQYTVMLSAQNSVITQNQNSSTDGFLMSFKNRSEIVLSENAVKYLKHLLVNKASNSFKRRSSTLQPSDRQGYVHQKYSQYYNDILVEDAIITVHSKDGVIETISGEMYEVSNVSTTPVISESQALDFALNYMGAEVYRWEIQEEEQWLKDTENNPFATWFPAGELRILKKNGKDGIPRFFLVYRFKICAVSPSRNEIIYVGAESGEIIGSRDIMRSSIGNAATRYSGTRSISTTLNDGQYVLRDLTRGNGINTMDLLHTGISIGPFCFGMLFSEAQDFHDNNNDWTALEWDNPNKDNGALEAHWAGQKTYDFYKDYFGRNSFDNAGAQVNIFMHPCFNFENAFWDGNSIVIGDGLLSHDIFSTLDIVAHEFTHALVLSEIGEHDCKYEPGAIEEGLCDIMSACVEKYIAPEKRWWEIGEEITPNNIGDRNMMNPSIRSMPDTYNGDFWWTNPDDFGGIHTNCTVLSHWFYLLAEGGVGVNDNGQPYYVEGIGMEAAASIVYRTMTRYLSPNTGFLLFKQYSEQATQDLFCEFCDQVSSVKNAWHAVGIGPAAPYYPDQLNVSQNAVAQSIEYYAADQIIANNTIAAGSNVLMVSGGTIRLTDGFTVHNSSFKAKICECVAASQNSSKACAELKDMNEEDFIDEFESGISLFPNPASSMVTISLVEDLGPGKVLIYDLHGKEVKRTEMIGMRKDIPLENLPKGVFVIQVETESVLFREKLIVQ